MDFNVINNLYTPRQQKFLPIYNSIISHNFGASGAGEDKFLLSEEALSSKHLDSMAGAESKALAMDINSQVENAAKRVYSNLKKYLRPLVASTTSPNNPICAGEKGIKYRIKDEVSICEKTASKDLKGKDAILKMGDVVGFRIVLRESSAKNIDKVFRQLGQAVKAGDLNIIEIENYLLPDGRSYVPQNTIEKLASVCNPNELKLSMGKKIPSGYPAVHIGIKTKEGYIFEIQVMGTDVEEIKDLDDFIYKLMDNKPLKKKYKSIQEKMVKALKSLTPEQKNAFMQYRRDSFTKAFNDEPKEYNTRKKSKFIDIPYFLPQELGYQWISEQKYYCDVKAKKRGK